MTNNYGKAFIATLLMVGSAGAMASARLTPAQCNDYPFKPLTGPVTHAQLYQEMAELESVGYDPTAADNYYPAQLQAAETRLQAKYAADCASAAAQSANR
jgi:hypothetical protein